MKVTSLIYGTGSESPANEGCGHAVGEGIMGMSKELSEEDWGID